MDLPALITTPEQLPSLPIGAKTLMVTLRPRCYRCRRPVTNFVIWVEETTYKMEAECLTEEGYACTYEFYRVKKSEFNPAFITGLAPEYS